MSYAYQPMVSNVSPGFRSHDRGLHRRGVLWPVVVVVGIGVIVVASFFGWLLVGYGCIDGNIAPGSAASTVCDVEVPKNSTLEFASLVVPIAAVLGGALLSAHRHERRIFYGSWIAAAILITAPVIALIVLPHS